MSKVMVGLTFFAIMLIILPLGYMQHEIGHVIAAKMADIPVTLSSDAHTAGNILYAFERGMESLKRVGYTEICRFKDRRVYKEPLENAIINTPADTRI